MDVDLEDLVDLEQRFYEVGYRDGMEHGRLHGLIEGRALGKEKGFEIWEEIGFYLAFASTWRAILTIQQSNDSRISTHLSHLLELIERFPMHNPSPKLGGDPVDPSGESIEIDITALLNRIRGRYKALCSSLGTRPRLAPASAIGRLEEDGTLGAGGEPIVERGDLVSQSTEANQSTVWSFTAAVKKAGAEGMTF
ncbi:hypothetical protein FRB91_003849 [Serendipita sp. 411]|nr:hypothetical protein FRB91_003849 [Serendipita sp. 411]